MKLGLRARLYGQLNPDQRAGGRSTLLNRALLIVIIAAIVVSVLATEPEIASFSPALFLAMEIGFGVIFLAEYLTRVWTAAERPGPQSSLTKRLRFVVSPLAIVDLIVVVVSLSSMFVVNVAALRALRLIRLVSVAKFGRFSRAFNTLAGALVERRFELMVTVALSSFLLLFGATTLYIVEGDIQPDKFGSIPRALWWSIITLTTVGYGDVSPITPLGKVLASIVALAGIGMVAMPTGIMAAAFTEAMQRQKQAQHSEIDSTDNDA